MTWASYHVDVVSILVGGAGIDEVSVTKEHKLDSPLTDERPGGMGSVVENGVVIYVVLRVFSSCTYWHGQVCYQCLIPL